MNSALLRPASRAKVGHAEMNGGGLRRTDAHFLQLLR